MPNLSKKKRKGKRGGVGDTVWSAREAEAVLRKHANDKFERRQEKSIGKGWKFGHMSANQALTQSDKYWMNQEMKARKTRGVDSGRKYAAFSKERGTGSSSSGSKGGIDIDSFADKHAAMHSMRTRYRIRNDADSDFDPSDSDLDDEEFVRRIKDSDDPFQLGRKGQKKKKKKRKLRRNADISDGDSDQMAESDFCEDSGDDLNRDEHNLKDTIDPSQMGYGSLSSDNNDDNDMNHGSDVNVDGSSDDQSDMVVREEYLPDFAESNKKDNNGINKKRRLIAKSKHGSTVELVESVGEQRRMNRKEAKKDLSELLDDSRQSKSNSTDGSSKSQHLWQLSATIENEADSALSLWNRSQKKKEEDNTSDVSDDDSESDEEDYEESESEYESSSDGPAKVTDFSGMAGLDYYNQNNNNHDSSEGDFSSSDEDVDMMERRKTREKTLAETVESGVGRLKWGRHKSNYYGTDTTRSALKDVDYYEADEVLRTEEAIGIQQQIDTQLGTRTTDYFDEEIMAVMRQGVEKQHQKKKDELYRRMNDEKQKILDDLSDQEKELTAQEQAAREDRSYVPPVSAAMSTVDSDDDVDVTEDGVYAEKIVKAGSKNSISRDSSSLEEKVKKDLSVFDDDELMKLVLTQHPELPGVVSELKTILAEMQTVKIQYDETQERKYDKAMQDSALFLELLRNYAAVLSFYLTLKTKNSGHVSENHPIFGRMLELKNAVAEFRPIHTETFKQFKSLPDNFDRDELAQKDQEMIVEGEKARLQALEDERNFHDRLRKSELKRREKNAELARKEREKKRAKMAADQAEIAEKYAKKEDWRLKQWRIKVEKDNENDVRSGKDTLLFNGMDEDDYDDDEEPIERRHINNRIFKSMGLKRYRKPGIPRLKQKLKYEKRLKQLRMRGYRPYKGKLPYTRGERRISTHVTHSTKF